MTASHTKTLVIASILFLLLFSLQQVVVFHGLGSGVSLGTVAILVTVIVAPVWLLFRQGVPKDLRLPLSGVIGCLLVLSVSTLLSTQFVTALKFAVRYATELALLWIFLNLAWVSRDVSRAMARATIWFLLATLLIGIGSYFDSKIANDLSLMFHSEDAFKYAPRVSAIYDHPGIFAAIGVMVAMLAIHLRQRQAIGRLELVIGVMAGGTAMVLAQTRNAPLALLIVGLVFLIFGRRSGHKIPVWGWLSMVVMVFAMLAVMYWLRYGNMFQLTHQNSSLAMVTSGRVYLWQGAFQAWLDNPWFGTGPGVFQFLAPEYTNGLFHAGEFHAHNIWLGILSETGLAGLVACSWLLITVFLPLQIMACKVKDGFLVIAWMVFLIAFGIVDFYYYSYSFVIHCALVVAFLYGEYAHAESNQSSI